MAVSTATSKRVRLLHYSVTQFILRSYLDIFYRVTLQMCYHSARDEDYAMRHKPIVAGNYKEKLPEPVVRSYYLTQ
jgi:hypothetical protein